MLGEETRTPERTTEDSGDARTRPVPPLVEERPQGQQEKGEPERNAKGKFVCPECKAAGEDREFDTKQGLGRHRTVVHNAASARAKARKNQGTNRKRAAARANPAPKPTGTLSGHDLLLNVLFPKGSIPVNLLDDVTSWLEEADRISAKA